MIRNLTFLFALVLPLIGVAAEKTFHLHMYQCRSEAVGGASLSLDNLVTVTEKSGKRTIKTSYCLVKQIRPGTADTSGKCPKNNGLELVSYRSASNDKETTEILYHDGAKTKASGLFYLNETKEDGGQFLVIDLKGNRDAGKDIGTLRVTSPTFRCDRTRDIVPNFETVELE